MRGEDFARFWREAISVILRRGVRYRPSFTGRATRKELAYTIGAVALFGFVALLLAGLVRPPRAPDAEVETMDVLESILFLSVTWSPVIAVIVRRLHDSNRAAWSLLVVLAPYVGWLVLLVLLFLDGHHGENSFGPDPRRRRL